LKETEARKRALVVESEVYRQILTLEIQNLRLYGVRTQRNLALLRLLNPVLLATGTLFGVRFVRRATKPKERGKWSRVLRLALVAWRFYRQFAPTLEGLLRRKRRNQRTLESEGAASVKGVE